MPDKAKKSSVIRFQAKKYVYSGGEKAKHTKGFLDLFYWL
jgi:hypothetical protein